MPKCPKIDAFVTRFFSPLPFSTNKKTYWKLFSPWFRLRQRNSFWLSGKFEIKIRLVMRGRGRKKWIQSKLFNYILFHFLFKGYIFIFSSLAMFYWNNFFLQFCLMCLILRLTTLSPLQKTSTGVLHRDAVSFITFSWILLKILAIRKNWQDNITRKIRISALNYVWIFVVGILHL